MPRNDRAANRLGSDAITLADIGQVEDNDSTNAKVYHPIDDRCRSAPADDRPILEVSEKLARAKIEREYHLLRAKSLNKFAKNSWRGNAFQPADNTGDAFSGMAESAIDVLDAGIEPDFGITTSDLLERAPIQLAAGNRVEVSYI